MPITLHLYVLCGSQISKFVFYIINRLVFITEVVFTARYALSPYITDTFRL